MAMFPFCVSHIFYTTHLGCRFNDISVDIYTDRQSMVLYVEFLDRCEANVLIQALTFILVVASMTNPVQFLIYCIPSARLQKNIAIHSCTLSLIATSQQGSIYFVPH
jgi:hypothetical protein